MVREISELLADSVDARARSVAGLTPAADDYATVVRTVRRRRVVRRSLQTLAVVPLVGGLAAGAYFGLDTLRTTEIGPAVTPTPTDFIESPPRVLAPLEKGELVTELGLPPFYEEPELLSEHAEPGWSVLTYRPVAANDASGIDAEPTAHALFLADPDGALFRTAELPLDLEVKVVHWDASSELARATWTGSADHPFTIGWLDVFTGELTEDPEQFDGWAAFLGHSAAGAELWAEDPAEGETGVTVWSIAPDDSRREVANLASQGAPRVGPAGRSLLVEGSDPAAGFAVVDIDSGEVREVPFGMAGQSCAVVGWLDAVSVAALCHDPVSDEAAAAMDRVDFVAKNAGLYALETVADGEAMLVHAFTEGQPVPEQWTGVVTESGALAYVASSGFPHGCSAGVGTWDGIEPRTVLGPGEHGSNIFWVQPGGAQSVLVTASQSCEASGVQGEVHSVDVTTGAARLLTPWVEAAPDDGIDYWHQTVSSAVTAG